MYARDLLLYAGLASGAFAGVLPRASAVSCKTPWVFAAVKLVNLIPAKEGITCCSSYVKKYATITVTMTSTTSISTSTLYSNAIAIAPTSTVSTTTTSVTSVFTTETDTSTSYIDVAATAETPTSTSVTTTANISISQVTDTITTAITTSTTTSTTVTDGTTTTTTSFIQNTAALQPSPNPAKRDVAIENRSINLPKLLGIASSLVSDVCVCVATGKTSTSTITMTIKVVGTTSISMTVTTGTSTPYPVFTTLVISATSSVTDIEETILSITTTTGTVTPDAVTITQTASTETTTTSTAFTTTTNTVSSTIIVTAHATVTSVSRVPIPKLYTFAVVQQGHNCIYTGNAPPNNFYYAAFNAADVENCALRCASSSTCQEFEYDHLNGSQPGLGICYLFDTLGNQNDIFCATGTTSFDYYGMYKLVSGR